MPPAGNRERRCNGGPRAAGCRRAAGPGRASRSRCRPPERGPRTRPDRCPGPVISPRERLREGEGKHAGTFLAGAAPGGISTRHAGRNRSRVTVRASWWCRVDSARGGFCSRPGILAGCSRGAAALSSLMPRAGARFPCCRHLPSARQGIEVPAPRQAVAGRSPRGQRGTAPPAARPGTDCLRSPRAASAAGLGLAALALGLRRVSSLPCPPPPAAALGPLAAVR